MRINARYLTDSQRALVSRTNARAVDRRAANRAEGRCVNENKARTHGPATHGVRCDRCDATYRRKSF